MLGSCVSHGLLYERLLPGPRLRMSLRILLVLRLVLWPKSYGDEPAYDHGWRICEQRQRQVDIERAIDEERDHNR